MITERPDIAGANRRVAIKLLLDGEIPLLNRRRLRIRLYSLRGEDSARWWRNGRGDWQKRKQRPVSERNRAVIRRERVQEEAEGVDQRIVGSDRKSTRLNSSHP